MKWKIVYFEQIDTNQPAEVFEDALLIMSSKLRGKLLQVTDALRYYGHRLGGGYIEKCHDYEGIWEIRIIHNRTLARELFGFDKERIVMLHGYTKRVGQPASVMTSIKLLAIGLSICELEISVLYRRKTMDRYEQRRQKLLQNPEVAAGYREMAAEMELMRLLDEVRKEKHLTQEELAERIGRKREAISRLFSADDVNPTIGTLIELLAALDLTADITLRHTREGEGPMKVVLESSATL